MAAGMMKDTQEDFSLQFGSTHRGDFGFGSLKF